VSPRRIIDPDEAARSIIHVGKRMYDHGFVAANDGNVSVRLSEGRLLTTPSGMSKGFLTKGDLVVTDMRGEKVSGKREPTSEVKMHIRAYELREDVGAVVHAHPPYATAFSVVAVPLAGCILPEVIVSIGSIPLTQYATPSTDEVPRSIEEIVKRYDAFLLRNHGVMTVGADILGAYHKIETVEHFAKITFIARHLGRINPLGDDDVQKLMEVRDKLGIKGPDPACQDCGACEPVDGAGGTGGIDDANLQKLIVEEVLKALKGR
jgi:L-fuculose-phosphate aldolase